MPWFLMIPIALVAITVALGPIVAALLIPEDDGAPEANRLPWGLGGTAGAPVPVRVDHDAERDRTPVH